MSQAIPQVGVHSEVGKLRKVLVCSPGLAHQRLTPSNCDELLFDDVMWVNQAKRDHFDFVSKMRERGVDLSAHRAQQLGRAHCASADLILVMDRGQRRLVEERYPLARGKVFRIGEHENFDVHDPYRQPRFVFERSARLLELGVNGWLSRLRLV